MPAIIIDVGPYAPPIIAMFESVYDLTFISIIAPITVIIKPMTL